MSACLERCEDRIRRQNRERSLTGAMSKFDFGNLSGCIELIDLKNFSHRFRDN